MKRSTLDLVITLPWLAAAVVLLVVARLDENARELRLALMGSAMICFSIGCLARTSVGLHELAERRTGEIGAATGSARGAAPAAGPVLPKVVPSRAVSSRAVSSSSLSPRPVSPPNIAAAADPPSPAGRSPATGAPPAAGTSPAAGPVDAGPEAAPPAPPPEPR